VKTDTPFRVRTAGGIVECTVLECGRSVRVDMGRASFASNEIPVAGPAREVLDETVEIGGKKLRFCCATVGNPHCVVLGEPVTPETACELGPKLETHPLFPNRTNVQFMEIVDRNTIRIEIWERGAGYTLASGSSSSASAAVARRLGLCDDRITVKMPGGELKIEIGAEFAIRMTGPVRAVGRGEAAPDLMAKLGCGCGGVCA
jgi:diaminopimelate epimerase